MIALLLVALVSGATDQRTTLDVLVGQLHSGEVAPTPGDWATYRFVSDSGLVLFLRIAAVAEDAPTRGLWLEIEGGTTPELEAPLIGLKLLCERRGLRLSGRVMRAFAVVGFEPAREVAPDIATSSPSKGLPSGFSLSARPRRPLVTPQGVVLAVPWELFFEGKVVQRIWMSQGVPVLHLALFELPALGQALRLESWGKDARSRIHLPAPVGEGAVGETPRENASGEARSASRSADPL